MESHYVIKRDGSKAEVKFDQITERNLNLCVLPKYGKPLNYVKNHLIDITLNVIARFKNNITTRELDMLTASVCATKSTYHSEYSDLAARIIVSDLHKCTYHKIEDVTNHNKSILSDKYRRTIERGLHRIEDSIMHFRDFNFTCFGIQTMIKSYLMKDSTGMPIERPQHVYMRVALALRAVEYVDESDEVFNKALSEAFEVYDLLSQHLITHASPTMFNSGKKHQQLASCFLLSTADDLDALLQVDKDAGMISKWAGGIGIGISKMRAEGSYIKSTGGQSSGIRRYIAKLNASQLYINQGGIRPGAYSIYLEPWHADIFTFLEMGRINNGPIVNAPDLKYALWVNDMFMEAVVEELNGGSGDWYLFSPDSAPGLVETHGHEFRTLYNRYVKEKKYIRKVKASAIITEWFKTVAQCGNPYILFKDQINKKSNLSHYRTITNSNLCVSGDTNVLTIHGQYPIEYLVDKQVQVWNGQEWSKVIVRQTSLESQLLNVSFDNGANITCTLEHRFYDHKGKMIIAEDLTPGVLLEQATSWPVIPDSCEVYKPEMDSIAYTHGVYVANQQLINGCKCIKLSKSRSFILDNPNFDVEITHIHKNYSISIVRQTGQSAMKFINGYYVMRCGHLRSKLKWFEGLCDSIGIISNHSLIITIESNPNVLVFMRDLRLNLQTMGCDSRIITRYLKYKTVYSLIVDFADLTKLYQLGFSPNAKIVNDNPNIAIPSKWRRPIQVTKVSTLHGRYPTFCFTEPLKNRGIFNGILTGQCAEITIPSFYDAENPDNNEYGTCNLAAIPLAKYVEDNTINWHKLIHSARVLVRNLDSSIDNTFYPVKASERSNKKHRPIAIGVMGLADVFAKLKIVFGSEEALKLDAAIHAAIYYGAMSESSKLGKEKGNFDSFQNSASNRGLLQPDLWELSNWEDEICKTTAAVITPEHWQELRDSCKKYLRNAYVTSNMPTATSSQVTGQNECFEPFTSNLYTRKTLAGEFIIINQYLLNELGELNLWDEEMRRDFILASGSIQNIDRIPAEVKERYKTSREINQLLITKHAKSRNPFLSQTQSLNYFFAEPNLANILSVIVYGWVEGLTTGSYYIHTQPAIGSAKTSVRKKQTKVVCTEDVCTSCAV